ncbi:MAG: ATP-binding cassette domain-containing protein, partial [Thermoleophilia bacterium]|nr:ATP-binding cassette domain-containing protein [Thermoleophilia bacterium]
TLPPDPETVAEPDPLTDAAGTDVRAAGAVAAARPGPALDVRAVTRRFGDRTLLGGLAFSRTHAGVIGITGSNGSGKTTLLRMCAQLCAADTGTIEVCGIDLDGGDAPAARALVGFAPHEVLAWHAHSVRANLRQALRLAGTSRSAAAERAEAALISWGLLTLAELPVGRLSRGQAQRYALARADLLSPPVLLLDEPTVGLDDEARVALDRAIAVWKADRIVVVASHERAWLAECADQVVAVTG